MNLILILILKSFVNKGPELSANSMFRKHTCDKECNQYWLRIEMHCCCLCSIMYLRTKLTSYQGFTSIRIVSINSSFQVNCKSHESEIVRIEEEVENLFLKDQVAFTVASGMRLVMSTNEQCLIS